ncbi:hypothetical protein GCM10007067_21660 [Lysobacter bugurensis]|uniref:Uncharacterized protein n=1 Tax=Cognatilysobacter bugurensis TaxID=543356 RepID=A0A918T307_9GAMM|nr:hypothetical protein GCM10007067_21660 [Lysobacter bugurensis]
MPGVAPRVERPAAAAPAPRPRVRCCAPSADPPREPECVMSKGLDRKKEQKKKPAKTPQEKRAAKSEKKATRTAN